MEQWDGTVLATCTDLGPKSLQLIGMHALIKYDTESYPYGQGNQHTQHNARRGHPKSPGSW